MSEAIKNRYDFVILFDVENGNPNGDPDAGNMPRVDQETGHGLVTDVCLKRKIRNYIEAIKEGVPGYRIYIKDDVPLAHHDQEACAHFGIEDIKKIKKDNPEIDKKIRDFMCSNFFDIRTFGAVMTTFVQGALNCGQVRGPVQLGFARSIDPILPQEITITRTAITTVQAAQAQKVTGFSEEDLELLWRAILSMFELDHSAARGNMATRELIIFRHESELGNAPAYRLFDRVHVSKKRKETPARSYQDYEVRVDTENLPEGGSCIRMS